MAPPRKVGTGQHDFAPKATKADIKAALAAMDDRNRRENRAKRAVAADPATKNLKGAERVSTIAKLMDYQRANPGKIGTQSKGEKADNASLDAWAKRQAVAAGFSPQAIKAKQEAATPAWGGLLDIGGDLLKVANFGSASGAYALSHAYDGLHKLTGLREESGPLSWDDVNPFGKAKGNAEGIFKQAGAPDWLRQWGGLATDIVADPAWLVQPVKMAKTAKTIVDVAEGAADVAKVADVAAKQPNVLARILGKIGTRTHMGEKGAAPVADAANAALGGTVKKHSVDIIPGGAHPTQEMQMAHGHLVDGRWFVTKTPHDGTKVFELREPGVIHPSDPMLSPTFKSPRQAVNWVKSQEGRTLDRSLEPKHVHSEDGGSINPLDREAEIHHDLAQGEMAKFQKGDLGIKLGFGKPNRAGGKGLNGFNRTFNTRIPLPGRTIGSMSAAAGLFRRDPMELVAHRMNTATREKVQGIEALMESGLEKKFPTLTAEDRHNLNTILATNHPGLNIEGAAEFGGDVGIQMLKQQGKWKPEMADALNYLSDRMYKQGVLEGVKTDGVRAPYWAQVITKDAKDALREGSKKAPIYSGNSAPAEIANRSRVHESILNYFDNPQQFADELVAKGGWDPAAAKMYADHLDEWTKTLAENKYYKERPGEIRFRESAGQDVLPETLRPEGDAFKVMTAREKTHAVRMNQRELEKSFVQNGWAERVPVQVMRDGKLTNHPFKTELKFTSDEAARMWQRIGKRFNPANMDGTFAATPLARFYQSMISHLKGMLTTANPAHPVGNAAGDSFNNMIMGNHRHFLGSFGTLLFKPGKAGRNVEVRQGQKWARLSTREERALKETYKVGDHEYTGAEIYTLSHMMGLGKGYVGEDIAHFIKMNEASKNPATKFYRMMQRYNATREDATRMQAWFRHMQSGDDPITSMQKTLVGTFDYGDLTDFEKNVLRHTFLFYTWMRKNTALQMKGPFLKPGLYSSVQAIENSRPKDPNEPGWMSRAGLLPIPGYGNIQSWGPWADLHRFAPDDNGSYAGAFRQNVLSSLAPIYKAPIEWSTNTNLFTGGDLVKYPGQNSPSGLPWVDKLAMALHLSEPTRQSKDGPLVDASPAWLSYITHQLGPLVSDTGRISGTTTKADYSNPIDVLTQITGLGKRVKVDPDAARKSTIAAAKRKANATRARNATAPPPTPIRH